MNEREVIEQMIANDDFDGLGKTIQRLFKLPQSLCKMRGECCRMATFKGTLSYEKLVELSCSDDPNAANAREFLTLFQPYTSHADAAAIAPQFVELVKGQSKNNPEEVTFFKCRFVSPEGRCQIHEDRPTGCRVYPFPHENTIYHPGCGFEEKGKENWETIQFIRAFFEKRLAEISSQITQRPQ